MKLWGFVIFNKTFLEQSIWERKWVSWCHRLTFFQIFCMNFFFFFFFLKHVEACPNLSEHIRANSILHLVKFYFLKAEIWDFVISVNNIHSFSSYSIQIHCSKSVSWKLWNSRVHNILIFCLNLHANFTFLCGIVCSFLKLIWNLDRIFPLKVPPQLPFWENNVHWKCLPLHAHPHTHTHKFFW